MRGEGMYIVLGWLSSYLLLTVIFSQESMLPENVVYVKNGSNATFTCTFQNSWQAIYFYDYTKSTLIPVAVFQVDNGKCKVVNIKQGYSALPCSPLGQTFSIVVLKIDLSYHNKIINCHADSTDVASTTIKIREILIQPNMTPSGKQTIKENMWINFTCTAKSIPKSSIEWSLNGSKLSDADYTPSPMENTRISTISYYAKRKDHMSVLYCRANDTFTAMNSVSAQLDINYAPTIRIMPKYEPFKMYVDQKNVTLKCIVDDANPLSGISYQWTNPDGKVLNESIFIATVSRKSVGQYACTALNSAGKSETIDKQVDVQYEPFIDDFNVSINEGSTLIVAPNVYANPAPSSIWWTGKNGFKYVETTLIIDNITKEQSGDYTCNVMNTLSPSGMNETNKTSQKTSYIDVHFIPIIHMEPEHNPYILFEKQENINLICVVDEANPIDNMTYQWINFSGTVQDNHLTITAVERSHKGMYACTARNTAGISARTTKEIVVQYAPSISNISKQVDIEEGNTLVLSPIIDANPSAALIWWQKQNDVNFRRNGPVLMITNIQKNDGGNHSCHAMNTLTPSGQTLQNITDEWLFFINVQYRPSIKIDEAPSVDVLENTTVTVHCIVIDANPMVSSLLWYKELGMSFTNTADFTIPWIQRTDTGTYICDAKNTIGNETTSVYINVLHGPDVKSLMVLNGSLIRENSTAVLQCEIESNPLSTVEWTFNSKQLEFNASTRGISYYEIINTTCYNAGTYRCSASNSILSKVYNTSKDVQLFVECSPRLDIYMQQPPGKIGLPLGGTLNLNVNIVAYPNLTTASWMFQPNLTNNNTDIINGNLESNLFRHTSHLFKSNLSEYDFGDYILHMGNSVGSMKVLFQVVPEGPPENSTLINATCGTQTALVYWITSFSGGDTQTFSVIVISGNQKKKFKTDVASSVKGEIKQITLNLQPGLYTFSIVGENRYDSAISINSKSCEVKNAIETEKQSVLAAAAGGGVGVAVILIGVLVLTLIIVKKRRKLKGKELDGGSRNLTDEDLDDGLQDNPLYVTTECDTINSSPPVYSQVNKIPKSKLSKMEPIDNGSVYSQVQQNMKKGQRKNDIEMSDVYENSGKMLKRKDTEETYANTASDISTKQNENVQRHQPRKNKDGLIYADLELDPSLSGKKFVIRGLENRTNYAVIDLNIKVDPLPSDDDDEGDEEKKTDHDKND